MPLVIITISFFNCNHHQIVIIFIVIILIIIPQEYFSFAPFASVHFSDGLKLCAPIALQNNAWTIADSAAVRAPSWAQGGSHAPHGAGQARKGRPRGQHGQRRLAELVRFSLTRKRHPVRGLWELAHSMPRQYGMSPQRMLFSRGTWGEVPWWMDKVEFPDQIRVANWLNPKKIHGSDHHHWS